MMVDERLVAAVEAIWRIPPPGPDNLLSAPAFTALVELCASRLGGGKAPFALLTALQSLGLPCRLDRSRSHLARSPLEAARALAEAYSRTTSVRRFLCPLDLADDLPELVFGSARVSRFTAEQLETHFNAPRLQRFYPTQPLQSGRLAMFQWLVVEEEVVLDPRPEARAVPILFADMTADLGAIEPHRGRFPPPVEAALFFLLLAPWEDWSTYTNPNWRGFEVPWIYTADDDLFARPLPPPSPETLSLQLDIVQDQWGDDHELERPTVFRLERGAHTELARLDEAAWQRVNAALAHPLFQTPVLHFVVRAFLTEGVDEVLAHMTAIEAAVGLEADHKRKLRRKPDPYPKLYSTERVAARLAGMLSDSAAADSYKALFDVRSAFVHGRGGVAAISSQQRKLARSLARRAAAALVDHAQHRAGEREEILTNLLDRGVDLLRRQPRGGRLSAATAP